MKRRTFLKIAGGSALALGTDGLTRATAATVGSSQRKIGYIQPNIPQVGIPPYRGTHYADSVPDTLDLAERARLTLNALTSPTDPDADYEIYMHLQVFSNPARMIHDFSDWCQQAEGFMEDLPLMRTLTGDSMNSEVDRAWTNVMLKSIGPDGLFYYPTEGRPWFYEEGNINMASHDPVILLPGGPKPTSDTSAYTQYTHPQPSSRVLAAITLYWLRSKDPIWKKAGDRMVDRWAQLATYKENYAYWPHAFVAPGASPAPELPMPLDHWSVAISGRFIQGLTQYYRASGYEPARQLAEKVTRYVRYEAKQFDPHDGRFLAPPMNKNATAEKAAKEMEIGATDAVYGGHFAGHAVGLDSMLDFAEATGDRELIDFVRKSFEWAKDYPTCIDLLGYFPTQLVPNMIAMVRNGPAGPVETCEVAYMIGLGVKLSHLGAGDYWDNVDRWLRNQFFENQLTSADWIYRLQESQDKLPLRPNESIDRPAERNLGGFAGWASINDWVVRHKIHRYGIMHCCTGNAARAIYYAWERMAQYDDGTFRLHLLMNHASALADVYSYVPNQGRVDMKVKKPFKETMLRVPEWVKSPGEQITCTVNGKHRNFGTSGRYIKLGPLAPGDKLTMAFPIGERTEKVTTLGVEYTLVVRGSTVVSIDPAGELCPFYQRASYRKEEVSLRKVDRFVSDQVIVW